MTDPQQLESDRLSQRVAVLEADRAGLMAAIRHMHRGQLDNRFLNDVLRAELARSSRYGVQRDEATGRYVATVEVDPDRAPHITWAFTAYATGNHTLDTLCAELEKRVLRTRRTAKQGGGPLSRTQLSRLLVNPYYIGTVRYGGAENPKGRHEPLIDKLTFSVVQRVLEAHAMACERDRKHHHYLKGSLRCDLCGERVSFVKGKSKTGRRYDYFACLGRVKGTGCKLPYIPTEKVEERVPRSVRRDQSRPAWRSCHRSGLAPAPGGRAGRDGGSAGRPRQGERGQAQSTPRST
jgi:hypothetical protein